ncbi:MAG: hypothetical protein GKR89_28580 [Candidatus Latescibacteria bacterium]|nr:hypothetical protein [Candidatus Latescibacterota bacterium]
MFTPEQVIHYHTFGYVIMRQVFSRDEIKTMQEEFEIAAQRNPDFTPKAGESTSTHFIMLGDDTPFFATLTEDERLYGPARQIFGEDTLLWEWHGYRFCMFKGTHWHANDGDPTHGRYKYGARYQWPLFEPVTADTGALRVIPGSHQPEYQWALRKADVAGLLNPIEEVGAVACEADLGDVVGFDTRAYHATAPYHHERRVASGIYGNFPTTREEAAVTGPSYAHQQEQWQQWRANKPGSDFRRRWEALNSRMEANFQRCNLRVEHGPDGAHLVPA